MTLGQAFGGYAAVVLRAHEAVRAATSNLLTVPLGGTAIGTGLGATSGYRAAALRHLAGCAPALRLRYRGLTTPRATRP